MRVRAAVTVGIFKAGQHTCEKVRGWIEADKWCELFAEKTEVADAWRAAANGRYIVPGSHGKFIIADAEPRTLYVYRKLRNGDAISRWAKQQGFHTTLDPSEMHVTIAHSKKAVDWGKAGQAPYADDERKDDSGFLTVPSGGARQLQAFGKDGKCAVVLLFNSTALSYRHGDIKDRTGATWDWPDYQPHVTITWNAPADLSTNDALRKIEPYRGPIELGPEIFEEVDTDWMKHRAEDGMANIGGMTFDGFGSSQLAYEYYKPGGPGWHRPMADHNDGRTRTVSLIRHGATDLNSDDVSVDRIRGWTDVPLSAGGREEAESLADLLAEKPPAAIYSSDLKRALHTADVIADHCGTVVTACRQDFRPWNVGVYAGQTTEDAMPDLQRYACETPDIAVPEGREFFDDFRRRFFKGLLRALIETPSMATSPLWLTIAMNACSIAWRTLGYPSDGGMDAATISASAAETYRDR